MSSRGKIFTSLFILFINLFSAGNVENLELGSAIYRELNTSLAKNHWHGALFNYFNYFPSSKECSMTFTEIIGTSDIPGFDYRTKNQTVTEPLTPTNYINDLASIKNEYEDKFLPSGCSYYGTYSSLIPPNTRANIVATGRDMTRVDLWCYTDMIDPENHWQWSGLSSGWYENWRGTIGDIDEMRCDAIVEFSYEDHKVAVSHDRYIADAGQSNCYEHNNWHDGDYSNKELCPKIQAGEDHGGSGVRSTMRPLISAPPVVESYNSIDINRGVQLNFKVSDNASVKAYVLIQVKKSYESTWKTLVDKYNNKWEFREVNLTEWSGSTTTGNFDEFHVNWSGKYDDGGLYYDNYWYDDYDYDFKITAIDQGANYSSTEFSKYINNLEPFKITRFSQSPNPVSPDITSATITAVANDYVSKYEWTVKTNSYNADITFSNNKAIIKNIDYSKDVNGGSLFLSCKASYGSDITTKDYALRFGQDTGCPYLVVKTKNGFELDNNLLHKSEFPENYGRSITDKFKISKEPKIDNGLITLKIKEMDSDSGYFDQFKLYKVYHPTNSVVCVTENNDIAMYYPEQESLLGKAILNNFDVTKELQFEDNNIITGTINDSLKAGFADKRGKSNLKGTQLGIITTLGKDYKKGIIPDPGEIKYKAGALLAKTEAKNKLLRIPFSRRERPSEVVIPLPVSLISTDFEIEWYRDFECDNFNLVPLVYDNFQLEELDLFKASYQNDNVNLIDNLSHNDSTFAFFDTKKDIVLKFKEHSGVSNMEETYILESTGYYLKGEENTIKANLLGSDENITPFKFNLSGAYPNPFNPITNIKFSIDVESNVKLKVFNVKGELVSKIIDKRMKPNNYSVVFDGASFNSGVYYIVLESNDRKITNKITLIK